MAEYKNRIAVVTGAASGLGYGIASKLLELGAHVAFLDIDSERLNQVETENEDRKGLFETRRIDVTKCDELLQYFSDLQSKHGRIDYLFNNAGIGGTLPFENASQEHWETIVRLNLFGVINGITAVYPIMKGQRSGHIINTSSISGIIPFPGQALYNTTKYAVTGLSLSLESELKNYNIKISIICPGMVRTRIFYKPIIGEEATEDMVNIPQEAITVEEAVEDIFDGIEKDKQVIITPRSLEQYYSLYKSTGKLS